MVIPSLILPSAGTTASAQSGGSTVGGEAASAGGLFAALLAALEGIVDGAAPGFGQGGGESGEAAETLPTLLEGSSKSGETDVADAVEAAAEASAIVAVANVPLVASAAIVPEANPVAAEQLSDAPTLVPQTANVVGNAVAAAAVGTAQPVQQPANVVQFAAPAQPAAAPATPAPTPTTPVVTPEPAVAPGEQPTLVSALGAVPVEPAESELPDVESRTAADGIRVDSSSADKPAASDKPETDKHSAKGFEKVKYLLDALGESEKSAPTPLRMAVEAFAKPVAGQSEHGAQAARPSSPAVLPVASADSAAAQVADVTKVTASIAPAELSAEAPRSVADPDVPDRPSRSTLPDLAQTAARGIRYLARNGEHRMSIRLIPESLGEVQIEVHSTKDALTVKLIAERAVVRDAMETHAHLLRDSLHQEGIEVRAITVSDDSGSGRGAFYQRDANASRQGERGQSQPNHQPAPDQSSGRNAGYAAPRARHEGAFDQVA